MELRLDRYLSEMNAASRSQARQLIRKGLVTVGGEAVRKPEAKVPSDAEVVCRGERVVWAEREYFMLNKPAGCLTAVSDKTEKVVCDFLPRIRRSDAAPCGRLDKDTEGLLLITNDGGLVHRLLSPKSGVEKTYLACLDAPFSEEMQALAAEGLDLGGEAAAPCRIEPAGDAKEIYLPEKYKEMPERQAAEITLTEGKYHEVKRIFGKFGLGVIYLKRISMGPLRLDPALSPGQVRRLTSEELSALEV